MDKSLIPIESVGFCLKTVPITRVYIDSSERDKAIEEYNNLTRKEKRESNRIKKFYRPKPKRIKMIEYISHMIKDNISPTVLANGYCRKCWDVGEGGNPTPYMINRKKNEQQRKAKRKKKNEQYRMDK
tara:strand:+ start:855 stop:1238 length:384 start_codon:yes stop_codon:yes gene_type:complete